MRTNWRLNGLFVALVASCSVMTSPEAAAVAEPIVPSILTHNLMLLPSGVTSWAADYRAGLAGSAPHMRQADVLVLTELFDNSATDVLFQRLAPHHPYRTPVVGRQSSGWNRTTGAYFGFPFEDGGVAIISTWSIRYQTQHVFDHGCGADYWSSKGFAYVALEKAGSRAHIVATHLQANDPGCDSGEAAAIRRTQLGVIDSYVRRLGIPTHEPVVIAGDLNVRFGTSEYSAMLSLVRADGPDAMPGHFASHDPVTNSIARYRSSSTPSRLDHVLLRTDHARPSLNWSNEVLPVHSAPYTMRDRTFSDFSDHYPVLARTMAGTSLQN